MLSDDQGSCTSTNISPQPLLITAGDIFPRQFAINMLLDEVLLEIFAFYVEKSQTRDGRHLSAYLYRRRQVDALRTLGCVCQRWRSIVLGSPCRLNLRIFCSDRTPVRKELVFQPQFPIVLKVSRAVEHFRFGGEDNILETLEHNDRVCDIELQRISSSLWEQVLPLMQKPFPILTDLYLRSSGRTVDLTRMLKLVVPDSFLGGSAPQLEFVFLEGISFPGLPNLLLSATHLVHLELYKIAYLGYFSADAMATCLCTLTRLEFLAICFELPFLQGDPEWGERCASLRSEWERRRTSPPTRTPLPFLIDFMFEGVKEYLEVIVDRIDAPLLDQLRMSFFRRPIFDTPRLAQFISRIPKFKTYNEARVYRNNIETIDGISLSNSSCNTILELEYHADDMPDWYMESFVHLCTSSLPQDLATMVERLNMVGIEYFTPGGRTASRIWQEFLQQFTGVKDLCLSPEIAPQIALSLKKFVVAGERVTDFLPVLQNIVYNKQKPSQLVPEGIGEFVTARQSSSHPITISLEQIS